MARSAFPLVDRYLKCVPCEYQPRMNMDAHRWSSWISVHPSLSVVWLSIHRLDVGFFGERGEARLGEAPAQLGQLEEVFGELWIGEHQIAHVGEAAIAIAGPDQGNRTVNPRIAMQRFELERLAIGGD